MRFVLYEFLIGTYLFQKYYITCFKTRMFSFEEGSTYVVENCYSSERSFYNYVRFRTRRPKQICSTFRATSSSIKFNWENQQFSCHETDVLFFKKMKKMNLPMLVFIFEIYILCVHRYTRHYFGDVYQHF